MNILHVIDSMGLGGAQIIVKGIFENQTRYNLFLFALREKKVTIEVCHKNILIFNSKRKYSFRSLFELRKIVLKKNIDILHCHLFKSQFFGYLLKRIWFPHIRLIFHEHGQVAQGNFFYDLFLRLSRKYVNEYIAVSNFIEKQLIERAWIKQKDIYLLPNFIGQTNVDVKSVNSSKKREGNFSIGFAGRLEKHKGCFYLINALPYLNFPYQVLISGTGSEYQKLVKLSKKLKINDRVVFLGYQKNIFSFYEKIDILVVPSLFEAFGLSAVEAQLSGVPVIASNVGGLPEVISDMKNGLLSKKGDSIDLANKIKILYSDRSLKESIVRQAREDAKKYSLDNYLTNLYKIYDLSANNIIKKEWPLISIVMVNYNGLTYLKRSIPSILQIDYPNYEFIVVDNGSTDGSLEFISNFKQIILLRSSRLKEKNYACNYGANCSRGEYLLMLDNDIIITNKKILTDLLAQSSVTKNFGCFSLAFINEGEEKTCGYGVFMSYCFGRKNRYLFPEELKKINEMEISYPSGIAIFIGKKMWQNLGGYDDFLPFGGDDNDLGMKIWMSGYRCCLYSKTIQIHIGMFERTNTAKYVEKLRKLVFAQLYTIVKNFNVFNVIVVLVCYSLNGFLRSIKQSLWRGSFGPFISYLVGYYNFLKNLSVALKKRKEVQSKRVIKEDIFLKKKPLKIK